MRFFLPQRLNGVHAIERLLFTAAARRAPIVASWALAVMLIVAPPAAAFYIDDAQNWVLRARIYSQFSVRTLDSEGDTEPVTKAGQLVQNRNFYNPELDAKLTPYLTPLRGSFLGWIVPDDLSGRLAAWGFYDGVYDYGAAQFATAASQTNKTFDNFTAEPRRAWFIEGSAVRCPLRVGRNQVCVPARGKRFESVYDVYPGLDVKDARNVYSNRQRINELYLSYSKGPVFVRIGRQAISWGESDTIAILDQNNPFDLTLAAPGVFEDLDEARIPLWTLRTSVNLFSSLGPLSSGFVEAYWVPGDLDTNTGITPILGASPYSPPGQDPQSLIPPLIDAQFVLLDRQPSKNIENSRWGVRVQTVVGRDYTVSAWYYTTFPNTPVPQALGLTSTTQGNLFTVQTVHKLANVVGLGATFFFEPADGIVRLNAVGFLNEPAFVPQENLSVPDNDPSSLQPFTKPGTVPRADFLRWEIGFDRFFFIRALNPSNSFTLISAVVGSWNITESSTNQDFGYNGQLKPGTNGSSPSDYVDLPTVQAFGQFNLQTDYWHGRLTPRLTYIQYVSGTYAVIPAVTYRWRDWLLVGLDVVQVGGAFQGLGFFRDRGQVSARVTYQLN